MDGRMEGGRRAPLIHGHVGWGPQILNKARAKQADRQGGREEAPIEASGPGQGVVIRGSCRAAEWAGQKGGRRKIERRRALASFSLSLSRCPPRPLSPVAS